jgi:hypothetical protein
MLKPFTLNGEGKAINVFNVKRQRPIQNAPTKGQCARDYLYGKDTGLEQKLVKLEGQYARIVTTLSAGGALPEDDKGWLRLFISIQMQRTEHAINKMREWHESMESATYRNRPEQKPTDTMTDTQLMMLSMRTGVRSCKYIEDLKITIFKNLTKVDFVLSDHPAVMTNRFHLQRLNTNIFGIGNSGLILLLPVSPRLCPVCYDGGVYSISNASGTPFVSLSKESDVKAVNEFQYLNISHNVYFSRWEDRTNVGSEANRVADERAKAKPKATVYVRDYADPSKERYKIGTPEEEAASTEEIIRTSFEYPRPSSWPSQIQMRTKQKMFSDGSAVGYVRKAEWLVAETPHL